MYGTVLTNVQIEQLMRAPGGIRFHAFHASSMKLAHYRLRPGLLFRPGRQRKDGSHDLGLPIHDFRHGGPYTFEPNEYLLITSVETIVLPEGVVGEVIPASTLVEQCFSLVAGKLDAEYGSIDGELFIMGMKNMLDERNTFFPKNGVANIAFHDFRGAFRQVKHFTEAQKKDFSDRKARVTDFRAIEDGVFPQEDDQ